MIRMLIVGYCFGIRCERRLCEEVDLNLPYRWFCRLGLDGDVPDHSTYSKNRHGRFRESDLLRRVFETALYPRGTGRRGSLCDRCQFDQGACQPAERSRARRSCHQERPAGRSKNIRLCSTMEPSTLRPMSCQVRLAGRSGSAMDRSPWRASLLRLFHQ